jgi:deoxyribose-phosphate aldolase
MIQGIMAMGFDFSKDFGGALDESFKNLGSGKAFQRALLGPSRKQFKMGLKPAGTTVAFLSGDITHNQAVKLSAKQGEQFVKQAAGEALVAGGVVGAGVISHAIKRPDDDKPPPVGAKPGQGAGNIAAKQQARARAIAAARGRFGIASTIATSPLGLTGGGTALGKKRLIGE